MKKLLLLAAIGCTMALNAKQVWVLDSMYITQSNSKETYISKMEVYQYNEYAQPTQEVIFYWSEDAEMLLPKYRYQYEYNDLHQEIKFSDAVFNGTKYVTSTIKETSYNTLGQKDSVIQYYPQWKGRTLWVYTYDTHGNEKGSNVYYKDTTQQFYTKWDLKFINSQRYVEIGGEYLLSNTEQMHADSTKVARYAYNYDANGNNVASKNFNVDHTTNKWVDYYLYTATYDANNNRLTKKHQYWDATNNKWKAPYEEEFMRYNDKNEMVYDSITGNMATVADNFKYDSQHRSIAYSRYFIEGTTRELFANYEFDYHPECGEMTQQISHIFNSETGKESRQTITTYVYRKIDVPSALDEVVGSKVDGVKKIMKNGQLLILRDGKTYNTQGQEL